MSSPAEQDRIAQALFTPVEPPPFAPPSAGDISIGQAAPLATRGLNGSAMWFRALLPLAFNPTGGPATVQGFTNQRYAICLLKQSLPAAPPPLSPLGIQPAT